MEPKIKYKKISGGIIKIGDDLIETGDTFVCYANEIPKAFADMFEIVKVLGETEEKKEASALKRKK